MIILTIMVGGSAKQRRNDSYTFVVEEDYYDIFDEHSYPIIYLSFPSFADFLKLNNIEQMLVELYDRKGILENEEILYNHFEKMEKNCRKMRTYGAYWKSSRSIYYEV